MANEMRKVYDYYYKEKWVFRLGYVRYLKAYSPLPLHDHGKMTEFVYLERGAQKYRAADKDYIVKQGEFFYTLPNEPHDTGSSPEERSVLYYLIIDLSVVSEMNLFTSSDEYSCISECFNGDAGRVFTACSTLSGALKHLLKCFNSVINTPHFDTRIRNALSEVMIAFCTPHSPSKDSTTRSIERSLKYICEHLEEKIFISDLAALDYMSLSTYNKYFIQTVGVPPGEYILMQKIEKTKELLSKTNLSVTEIAGRYGFSSSQYFATVFKRFCNMTPTQYRNSTSVSE